MSSTGAVTDDGEEVPIPDPIWQGGDGTWTERTSDLGMIPRSQAALVAVDLDGDGWLDLVDAHRDVYTNPCGSNSWIDIELVGPPSNSHGLGVRVELHAGGKIQVRELHSLRTYIQSATRLHFGLGEVDMVEYLVVVWPDGLRSEALNVPTRRVLTLVHQDGV